MDATLGPLFDDSVICYLDNILIFSDFLQQHTAHVTTVLERLRENRLFCKASKCKSELNRVRSLGFNISSEGVSMEEGKME